MRPGFVFSGLNQEEWRLSDIHISSLNNFLKMSEEKGQKKSTDVASVDVRVGHDDDSVISHLFDIKFFANTCSHGDN